MAEWSPKQRQVVENIYDLRPGINLQILSGGKRSGKSYCIIKPWVHQVSRIYRNHDLGMVTASEGRREAILTEIQVVCQELDIGFRRAKRHVKFGDGLHMYYWIGNSENAHAQVEGHTFVGGIMDEMIRLHQRSVREMVVRCTPVGKPIGPIPIVGSTNPSSPAHPVKTGLMADVEAGRINGAVHYFELADNPALDAEDLEALIQSYPEGPVRQREAFGRWVEIAGAMFPGLDNYVRRAPIEEQPLRCSIAIDPTVSGTWAALLLGHYSRNRTWALAEWYHPSGTKGNLTRGEAVGHVIELARKAPSYIQSWIVDSADPAFGAALEAEVRDLNLDGPVRYSWPKPEIVTSVRAVNQAFGLKRLYLDPAVSNAIDELRLLHWSDSAYEASGRETPDNKSPDHLADCLRYAVWLAPDTWKA